MLGETEGRELALKLARTAVCERYYAIWMLLSHLGQGDLDLSCAAHSQHPALLGDCHPIPLPAAERTSHETISFSLIFCLE